MLQVLAHVSSYRHYEDYSFMHGTAMRFGESMKVREHNMRLLDLACMPACTQQVFEVEVLSSELSCSAVLQRCA